MLKELLPGLMKLNAITGIEVHIEKDGQLMLHACSIRILKQQLNFESRHPGLKNVLHLSKVCKAGPVALCLTGKGIITKKIEKVTVLDQQVINQVLPNANPDLFYFQHHLSGHHSIVSAIRRTDVDGIIVQLREYGFSVLSLSLEAFVLEEVMKPEEGQLDSLLLLAYAVAFQLLLSKDLIEIEHKEIIFNRVQAFAKARIMGITTVFCAALFVLLLINFMLFSYYSDQVKSLSAVSNITATEVGKLKDLEKDINRKTALITRAGWTGGLNYAYITDQLMMCMPRKISLQEFMINPLDEAQSRNNHDEVYVTKMVQVKGLCSDASMLNNWIFAIKAKDWVEECKILNYTIDQDNGSGLFAIAIQLKDYEE